MDHGAIRRQEADAEEALIQVARRELCPDDCPEEESKEMNRKLAVIIVCLSGGVAMAEELPEFDKLWNYSKPDETEKKFRELLPQAEASHSSEHRLASTTF